MNGPAGNEFERGRGDSIDLAGSSADKIGPDLSPSALPAAAILPCDDGLSLAGIHPWVIIQSSDSGGRHLETASCRA